MRRLARDERADSAALLATLPPPQWLAPTLCARWRVRQRPANWRLVDSMVQPHRLNTMACLVFMAFLQVNEG
jgi:hypothetical protein